MLWTPKLDSVDGSYNGQLSCLHCTSSLAPESMSRILVDYHKFHEVFSDAKANMLPPHQPYDLQISLEEGVKPFHSPIYSLLPPELVAL